MQPVIPNYSYVVIPDLRDTTRSLRSLCREIEWATGKPLDQSWGNLDYPEIERIHANAMRVLLADIHAPTNLGR